MRAKDFKNEYDSNHIIALCINFAALLAFISGMAVLVGLLPVTGSLTISQNDAVFFSIAILGFVFVLSILPLLIVIILKKKNRFIKYYLVSTSIIIVGVLHAVFGDYVIVLYLFPALLSIIYFNQKISLYVIITTTVFLFISTFLSRNHFIIASSLFTPETQILRFILNIGLYLLLSTVCLIISNKSSTLMFNSLNEQHISKQQNDSLDKIIINSQNIFTTRNLTEFHAAVKMGLIEAIEPFKKDNDKPFIRVGYLGTQAYYISNEQNKYEKLTVSNDLLTVKTKHEPISIYINRTDKTARFTLYDHCLVITFFSEHNLIHFIIVEAKLDIESPVLNDIMEILVGNIGIALRNLRLTLDMLSTQAEMVFAFSQVTELKSHQTGNHIRRVSEFMRILALGVGYTEEYAEKISIAAMLHDIGKVFIPDEILEKKTKLTPSEYVLMKTHTTKGIELINDIPGDVMQIAKILIREHHERWDGSGYLGLVGDQINILARLIAVADVFDALISKRSYKDESNPKDVYDKITEGSGKEFDPRIVEVFKKNFKKLLEVKELYEEEE